MNEREELKPCPFCGGEDIELWTGFGTQAEIGCQSCCCERSVQVADMREDGEAYPEFDQKTFRYPDWMIERTNQHLITEWNTRASQRASVAQTPFNLGDIVSMRDGAPFASEWRGIKMKVVSLRMDPHGTYWVSVVDETDGYPPHHRGNGVYVGETTDIDAGHLSSVSSTQCWIDCPECKGDCVVQPHGEGCAKCDGVGRLAVSSTEQS